MVARARASILEQPLRTMDMRSLWRLAIWGSSATLALLLAVVACYSDTGSRRLAMNGAASRVAEAEAETRRLAETVRMLAADRERLTARIGTLERNLEDMTGSIRRQSAKSDAAGPTMPSTVAAPAAPTPPAAAPEAAAPKAPEAASEPPSTATPAPWLRRHRPRRPLRRLPRRGRNASPPRPSQPSRKRLSRPSPSLAWTSAGLSISKACACSGTRPRLATGRYWKACIPS